MGNWNPAMGILILLPFPSILVQLDCSGISPSLLSHSLSVFAGASTPVASQPTLLYSGALAHLDFSPFLALNLVETCILPTYLP